jgi:GGDEF domain-containing protein
MKKPGLKVLLLAWAGLVLCFNAIAQIAVSPAPVWRGLQYPGDVLMDESGQQSLTEMQGRFERGESASISANRRLPLGGLRTAWFRIRLPAVTSPAEAVLTIVHPGMDSVVLYSPGADGGWQAQRSGDSIPVVQWPMAYLHPAFPVVASPADTRPVYLAVRHGNPVGVYWQLWDRASFDHQSKTLHMALGGYLGFVLLVVILSCLNAYNWRDSIHLLYAAHVAVLGLAQLSLTGLAGEFLWPGNAWWNDIAAVTLPALSFGVAALMVDRLVIERGHHLASRLLVGLVCLSLAFSIGFVVFGRDPLFYLSNLAFLVFLPIMVGSLIWFALRRPAVGLWALAGFLSLFIGATFPILRNLGLVPINFYTQYGSQIGAAIEIPLVLVALYFRSRDRRDNQVRLSALSRVDPLTGLASHHLVMDRLERLLLRHQRDPLAGAVLQVRVINMPEIRANHGTAMAQALPVHAGACVVQAAELNDTVGRHGDGDFILLMDGKYSARQITGVAQRIIAAGLRPGRNLPPDLVLHLHVACADGPLPLEDASSLLQRLGSLLDEMALTPGKAIRFLPHLSGSELQAPESVGDRRLQRTRMPGMAPGSGSST